MAQAFSSSGSNTERSERVRRAIIGNEPIRFYNRTTIYYTFDTANPVSASNQAATVEAFNYLAAHSCLNYVEAPGGAPANAEDNWLQIRYMAAGCFASLGRNTGGVTTYMNLDPGCDDVGVIIHEIL